MSKSPAEAADRETAVSLLQGGGNIRKKISIRRKRVCVALSVAACVISAVCLSVVVFCFADFTLRLRCSVPIKFEECKPTGTLESLHAVNQNFTLEEHGCEEDECTHFDHAAARRAELIDTAVSSWNIVWEILHDTKRWHLESGKNMKTGLIHSKTYRDFGTVYKLQAYVDCSPQELFDVIVTNSKDFPKWSSMFERSQLLEQITENIEIEYSVSPSQYGEFVSRRDYVTLRHWKEKDNITLCTVRSIEYPEKPPTADIVRGYHRPSGMLFRPIGGQANRCILEWSFSTDIKGWIPQWLLNQGITSAMQEFLHQLKEWIKTLQKGRA